MAVHQEASPSGHARTILVFVLAGVLLGLLVLRAASQEPHTLFVEREWTKPWATPAEVETWHATWHRRAARWADPVPDPPGEGPVEIARYWLSRQSYSVEVRRRGARFVVAVGGVDEQVLGGGWTAYGEGRIEGAPRGFGDTVATFRWSCLSVRYGTASDGVGRIRFSADGSRLGAVYMAHEAPTFWFKAYAWRQVEGGAAPPRGTIRGQIPFEQGLAQLPPHTTHRVRIRVMNAGGAALAGAVVQLRGHTRSRQATDGDGYATIHFPSSAAPYAQTFSAGKEGYFNAETTHFTGDLAYGRGRADTRSPTVVIRLDALEGADHPAYAWTHPSRDQDPDDVMACANCHTWQYDEWIGSRHARMADNGLVEFEHRRMRTFAPEAPDDCIGCHQPGYAATNPGATGWQRRGMMASNHCDFCHKIQSVGDLRESGVLGAVHLARPDPDRRLRPGGIGQVFGTAPDATYAYMGASYNPLFAASHFCAACHQGGGRWREGTPPKLDTFNEWRRWAVAVAMKKQTPKTCQDCHMPAASTRQVDGTPVDQLAYDAMHRQPEDVHGHRFQGRSPEFAAPAIDVQVEKAFDEASREWVVTVVLENTGAGHKIPTGTWTKHVVVGVWADSDGGWLPVSGGERAWLVPDGEADPRAGREPGDWRNPAGTVLGMAVRGAPERARLRPAFYAAWPAGTLTDTRLVPGTPRRVECRFEGEGVRTPPRVVVWIAHRRGDLGPGAASAPFPLRPYDAPPEVVWKRVTR